jgi:hypothetical protein
MSDGKEHLQVVSKLDLKILVAVSKDGLLAHLSLLLVIEYKESNKIYSILWTSRILEEGASIKIYQ